MSHFSPNVALRTLVAPRDAGLVAPPEDEGPLLLSDAALHSPCHPPLPPTPRGPARHHLAPAGPDELFSANLVRSARGPGGGGGGGSSGEYVHLRDVAEQIREDLLVLNSREHLFELWRARTPVAGQAPSTLHDQKFRHRARKLKELKVMEQRRAERLVLPDYLPRVSVKSGYQVAKLPDARPEPSTVATEFWQGTRRALPRDSQLSESDIVPDLRDTRRGSHESEASVASLGDNPEATAAAAAEAVAARCADVYAQACLQLQTIEVPRIRAQLGLEELALPHYGLGEVQAQALARALESNTTLQRLDLRGNHMTDVVATPLIVALERNSAVRELDLSRNELSWASGAALGRTLEINVTIQRINLAHNKGLRDRGASKIVAALRINQTLQDLDLTHTDLSSEFVRPFKALLRSNGALRSLNLSWNSLGARGAQRIAEAVAALEGTGALRHLVLSWNAIGTRGALHLPQLVACDQLARLDLSHNDIQGEPMGSFADALGKTTRLEWLDLSFNPLGEEAAVRLLDVARRLPQLRCLRLLHAETNITRRAKVVFDAAHPDGHYRMDLSAEGERDIAQKIIKTTFSDSGNNVKNETIDGARFVMAPNWVLPHKGILELDYVSTMIDSEQAVTYQLDLGMPDDRLVASRLQERASRTPAWQWKHVSVDGYDLHDFRRKGCVLPPFGILRVRWLKDRRSKQPLAYEFDLGDQQERATLWDLHCRRVLSNCETWRKITLDEKPYAFVATAQYRFPESGILRFEMVNMDPHRELFRNHFVLSLSQTWHRWVSRRLLEWATVKSTHMLDKVLLDGKEIVFDKPQEIHLPDAGLLVVDHLRYGKRREPIADKDLANLLELISDGQVGEWDRVSMVRMHARKARFSCPQLTTIMTHILGTAPRLEVATLLFRRLVDPTGFLPAITDSEGMMLGTAVADLLAARGHEEDPGADEGSGQHPDDDGEEIDGGNGGGGLHIYRGALLGSFDVSHDLSRSYSQALPSLLSPTAADPLDEFAPKDTRGIREDDERRRRELSRYTVGEREAGY